MYLEHPEQKSGSQMTLTGYVEEMKKFWSLVENKYMYHQNFYMKNQRINWFDSVLSRIGNISAI